MIEKLIVINVRVIVTVRVLDERQLKTLSEGTKYFRVIIFGGPFCRFYRFCFGDKMNVDE